MTDPSFADTIRAQIEHHRDSLRGWAEPHGHLVPSEPNPDERALIRIRLRASIVALLRAVGIVNREQEVRFEDDDLRDRLRIADRAAAEVLASEAHAGLLHRVYALQTALEISLIAAGEVNHHDLVQAAAASVGARIDHDAPGRQSVVVWGEPNGDDLREALLDRADQPEWNRPGWLPAESA